MIKILSVLFLIISVLSGGKPLDEITDINRYNHCWKCKGQIDRIVKKRDYPYGNFCENPNCRTENGLMVLASNTSDVWQRLYIRQREYRKVP